jgi:hypothetical protein
MRFARPLAVAVVVVLAFVLVGPLTSANAAQRKTVMSAAASYASSEGYKVGIAVLDTKTGHFYGSGDFRGVFASESIVKVFIATRLLLRGAMHGQTETRAYKMITQSDDAIASSFYSQVGGDSLIGWIKNHYHVGGLGYRPSRSGWWGNTHIRPQGLVRLYAKLKADRRVGPWLLNAMHHATMYGSDGVYQFFGLPSATKGAAVKQGWGDDFDYGGTSDFNSTGFVNNDRYAIAILARGKSSSYGSQIGALLTSVAKRLLPGGRFPDPQPRLSSLSKTTGRAAGGMKVTVHGTDLTGVRAVWFGTHRATNLKSLSAQRVQVVAPAHKAGTIRVRVATDHGKTPSNVHARFTYVAGPKVTGVQPGTGPPEGGTVVTVTGTGFDQVTSVRFGGGAGTSVKMLSQTRLQVTAPPHQPGPVDIVVTTAYGTSPTGKPDQYTYAAQPPAP